MARIKSVSLVGVKDLGPIHFIRAEWKAPSARAVLIRYSVHGKEQEFGLRLDLDKKIILDPLKEVEIQPPEDALRDRTEAIWQIVSGVRASDEAFSP